MLRSCGVCGKIHKRGEKCPLSKKKKPKRRKKDSSAVAVKFRSGGEWTEKARRIKERDKWMCRVCLEGDYPIKDDSSLVCSSPITGERIVFTELEVHHIDKISERYDLRLSDENLITLCRKHHRMAEEGEIPKEYLRELRRKKIILGSKR